MAEKIMDKRLMGGCILVATITVDNDVPRKPPEQVR